MRNQIIIFFSALLAFCVNLFAAESQNAAGFTEFETKDSCAFICKLYATHPRLDRPLLDGKLTPFWAQEYIGADLARDFIKEHSKLTHDVNIGVLDTGFDLDTLPAERKSLDLNHENITSVHGTAVLHLIAGEYPIGVAEKAKINVLVSRGIQDNPFELLEKEVLRKKPKVVNISHGGFDSEQHHLENINKNTILILGAGNEYPVPVQDVQNNLSKAIVVGSLSPIGSMSHFSSEGSGVAIAAPSDHFIQTVYVMKDEHGNLNMTRFGGTSGAAPLVTGSLGNVLSFLSDLSPEEAKILLEKTAILTPNAFENKRKNGAGMLNAYKLVRVAKRLAEKDWDTKTPTEKLNLLQNEELYRFSEEAQSAFEHGARLFRETQLDSSLKSCRMKQEAILSLRRSFFLNPSNDVIELLEKIYQEQHLDLNARFYRYLNFHKTIRPFLLPHFDQNTNNNIIESINYSFMSRPVTSMNNFAKIDWMKFFDNFDPSFRNFFSTKETARGDRFQIEDDPDQLVVRGNLENLKFIFTNFPESRVSKTKSGFTVIQLARKYAEEEANTVNEKRVKSALQQFLKWVGQFYPEYNKVSDVAQVTTSSSINTIHDLHQWMSATFQNKSDEFSSLYCLLQDKEEELYDLKNNSAAIDKIQAVKLEMDAIKEKIYSIGEARGIALKALQEIFGDGASK